MKLDVTKNAKSKATKNGLQPRLLIVACLILSSLMICLLASPLTRTQLAASRSSAQPKPASSDGPLDEAGLEALKAKLTDALKEVVEDEETQTSITEKWDARMESLVGKTAKQVVDLFLADVESAVEDAEAVSKLKKSFIAAANDSKPATEPEPTTEPATTTAGDPKPSASPVSEPKPVTHPNTNATLRQYIRSLNYDPRRLLAADAEGGVVLYDKPDPSKPIENMRKPGSGNITRCTKIPHNMKAIFDEIAILQPTRGVIYPGALIFADKQLIEGKPRPMNGLPRAPLDLRLDLPGLVDEGSFQVVNPTDGKVQSGINKALNFWNNVPASKEGFVNPANQSFHSTVAYTTEQLALGLGFNAEWASGAASAQLKASTSSEKNVVVAVWKQGFYTVSYDAPNLPEQFFDSSVSADDAREIFNSEMPPAYVSSVTYGRIIMLRMETDKNESNIKAEAAFKYATGGFKVGGNLEMEYKKLIANSQFTVVTMGGNAEAAAESVSAKGPEDLFPIIKGKNSVYSKSNPGVPIAYTVKFLKDDRVALMGANTDYVEEKCETLNNLWLELRQNGVYVAHFEVTWDEPGSNPSAPPVHQKREEDHGLGSKMVVNFPGDANNIHVVLKTSPGRLILDRFLTPADLNKAFQTDGIVTGPGWSQECKDQTGKVEWKQSCN
jgi:thiol-activated cytolysin